MASTALATVVPAGDVVDQTWTANGNPYEVQGTITVPEGAFLHIEAGTTVVVSGFGTRLVVNGELQVSGTDANRVTFGSATPNDPMQRWDGIRVRDTAVNSSIVFADLSQTDGVGGLSPLIVTAAPTFTISDSVLHDAGVGVRTSGGQATIERMLFHDISSAAIRVASDLPTMISDVTIRRATNGITVTNGGGASIANAVITGCGEDGADAAIRVNFVTNNDNDTFVTNCTLHNNLGAGIEARESTLLPSSVVVQNSMNTQNANGLTDRSER